MYVREHVGNDLHLPTGWGDADPLLGGARPGLHQPTGNKE